MRFAGIQTGGTTRPARSPSLRRVRKVGGCLDGGKRRDILKSTQKGKSSKIPIRRNSDLNRCSLIIQTKAEVTCYHAPPSHATPVLISSLLACLLDEPSDKA